jgi:hypothetical protein
MPYAHLILLVLSVVLFLVAGFLEWPANPPANPPRPFGHALGWFAGAALAASFLVS